MTIAMKPYTVEKTLFSVLSAKLVMGPTQRLASVTFFGSSKLCSVRLVMNSCVTQNEPPTSARSDELKYPQHLNCVGGLSARVRPGIRKRGEAHLVLNGDPLITRQRLEHLVEVVTLAEGVEPDTSADDEHGEHVDEEHPVQ